MKVMTVAKLELRDALLATRLKKKICPALTVTVVRVSTLSDGATWTDGTDGQKTKHPIFITNSICEILEYTLVDQWNYVSTLNNPADADTHGMSADVLQSSKWVRGSDLLRTNQLLFVPNNDVVDNIKLVIVIKEQSGNSISF